MRATLGPALLCVLPALGLLACRPEGESARPEGAETGDAETGGAEAETAGAEAGDPPTTCGPVGEVFRDLAWVPADTRFVAWVELAHPEFDAAAAHLSKLGDDPGRVDPALPIYAATDLNQLGFELSSLGTTLAFGGFDPAQIVKLHGPDGVPVYVWPSSCDLDLARRQLQTAYGVSMRKAVDGMVGTASDTEFPFDVLLLRGDRAAFVPSGKAPLVLDWLAAPASPTLAGDPAPEPGPRLRQLAPAPFRILLQGTSLVAGEGTATSGVRTLRATAAGVEIDGRLPPP